ncbi:MAG: ABC transporter ATP-binding protein, partial [Pseudomonadota bacterium]
MSAPAVLTAEQLTVARGGHSVLDGMSFTVAQGDVFALLGGNGAGKSTTLLTFLGFIAPTRGRALVFGEDVQANRAEVHRRSAYLPETASLYAHLSARENLAYFLSLSGTQRAAAEQEAALDEVGLATGARGQALDRYSKGMRQKVAIALAILRETPLLL